MATNTTMSRPSQGMLQQVLGKQAFWVTISVFLIPVAMTVVEPSFSAAFWKEGNFFNVTRNFAFIAIIALGQVVVMITGGIDLSVGSVLAVCGIVLGLLMTHDYSLWVGALAAIGAGVACGL